MRGHTIIEALVALSVLTLLTSVITVGQGAQLRGVKRSFDELKASRAAAGLLEEVRDAPLVEGEERVGGGTRTVRMLEPGLYEITAVVDGFALTTRLAREVPR